MALEHTVRTRDGKTKKVVINRNEAIKLHCTECMGDQNPKDCTSPLCALFPFRKATRLAFVGD